MNKQYQQVLEFTKTFGQSIPTGPTKPPQDLQDLRGKLSIEESLEIRESADLKEYLDGCADLLYIALGNFIAAGFGPEHIEAAMNEVHRSNMSKLWTLDEVQDIRDGTNTTSFGDLSGGRFNNKFDVVRTDVPDWVDKRLIVSRKDGKIVKPPSFSPPNLSRLLP
jgi:hypothetical protein